MPKAYLVFDLPDEQSEYNDALHGQEYIGALWSFGTDVLRHLRKYTDVDEAFSKSSELLCEIEKRFYETLSEYNINIHGTL